MTEPQVEYCATGPVHDECQQDDGQNDDHHPEEEHDDPGDGISRYSSRSSHGRQLPAAARLIRADTQESSTIFRAIEPRLPRSVRAPMASSVPSPRKVVMADVVHQLPALIGVIVGALASFLAGSTMERTRWKHERASRWDDKRAQIYSDYGYAIKNVYVQCVRIANSCRGLGQRSEIIDCDQALADLGQLTDHRTAIWESVLLMGDPATIAAARAWHRGVWQVERFARGERTDADEWHPALDQIATLRAAFYEAARHDLGIRSGDIPSAGPWERPSQPAAASY
jgi:hypothetical protein